MIRPAEFLVVGYDDGPVVLVSGRVAALLVARAGLAAHHRAHRGEDPELDNTLVALKVAAAAWRTAVAGGGRNDARRWCDSQPSAAGLSTTQAARRIGCSPRTVRRAIAAGRLPAERIGAGWVLDPLEVEHYRARRAGA